MEVELDSGPDVRCCASWGHPENNLEAHQEDIVDEEPVEVKIWVDSVVDAVEMGTRSRVDLRPFSCRELVHVLPHDNHREGGVAGNILHFYGGQHE